LSIFVEHSFLFILKTATLLDHKQKVDDLQQVLETGWQTWTRCET
jgi:hypothetical protein